ncbi:MAG: HAD family hydrolase [Lachnospiraceae bacterium]|nr:HAD family hydrolase [Lachnospiraceae bacterium]
MYQYILFDLDGTLTDPEIGITNCVMYALEKFGIQVEDRKELHPFIGPPIQYSFQEFYGFSEEDSKQAVAYFRERFAVKGLYENQLFDGIEELLKDLKAKGKKIILATCKLEEYGIAILKYFKIYEYFDFVAGSTIDGGRKEKEEVIAYALEMNQIQDKTNVIMVGDTKYDIIGANKNEIDSIGVLFGYGDYQELKETGATYIVDTIADILKYV